MRFKLHLNRAHKIGIAGGFLFLLAIIFQTAVFPAILESQLKKKIALKKGWKMRDIWGKFPFPMDFQIYVFNITNHLEMQQGAKPKVQEIGPFIYDEWLEKTNQMDHEEDDTVSYTLRHMYQFNLEKSNGFTGEEEIIVPESFIFGAVNTLLKDRTQFLNFVSVGLDHLFNKPDNLFVKRKVKDLLFEGRYLNCTATHFAARVICDEVRVNYKTHGIKKINETVFNYSLMGAYRYSDDILRTRIHRGLKNIMDVGTIVQYNNKTNISIWNDDYCNQFNGTDGSIFHPFFDKRGREDLTSFDQSFCRTLSLSFISPGKFAGLKTLRYTLNLGLDIESKPDEKCYCKTPNYCSKPGLYDNHVCSDIPFIFSNPHFYNADPYYRNALEGINPIKEKHMTIVEFEPLSGTLLYRRKRIQANGVLTSLNQFRLMQNYPDVILPLFWIDEQFVLPEFLIKEIKAIHKLRALLIAFQYIIMFGGLGVCGYAGFTYYKLNRVKKQNIAPPTNASEHNNDKKEVPITAGTTQPPLIPTYVD